MKFYEVQKALEEGKKIKSKKFGTFFLKDGYLYYEHGSLIELMQGFAIYVILSDDWEIIDDIPEIEVKTITEEYVICPGCKTKLEIIESHKNIRVCGYCGKNIKLKQQDEHSKRSDLKGVYVNPSWINAYLEK